MDDASRVIPPDVQVALQRQARLAKAGVPLGGVHAGDLGPRRAYSRTQYLARVIGAVVLAGAALASWIIAAVLPTHRHGATAGPLLVVLGTLFLIFALGALIDISRAKRRNLPID